jgi:serine/threonine protein kinase
MGQLLSCFKQRNNISLNAKPYIAGSSFTKSEAFDDGEICRDISPQVPSEELEIVDLLPIVHPITYAAVTEGSVFGTGNDKLQIKNMISSGGFGDVWRAKYNGKEVAVKTLKEAPDIKLVAKLERMLKHEVNSHSIYNEAKIMDHLKHDRIVLFIGLRLSPLSLVMEYLPLGTLHALISEGEVIQSWQLRYQMMLDICEGMEYLHAANNADGSPKKQCFHQDLKTGNVLLEKIDGEFRAKITDFGLSRIVSFS